MGNQKAAWHQRPDNKSQCLARNGVVMATRLRRRCGATSSRVAQRYGSVDDRELVSALVRGAGMEEMLTKLTSASVALVPRAEFARISLIGNGHLRSIAATSESIALLDGAQRAAGQGPCLDAVRTQKPICCSDYDRRPMAAIRARGHDRRCAPRLVLPMGHAWRLRCDVDPFRISTWGVRKRAAAIATMLANHAAIALFTAEHERQFRAALATRDIIGQAKGMVMERFDVDSARAFAMLKTISQADQYTGAAACGQTGRPR